MYTMPGNGKRISPVRLAFLEGTDPAELSHALLSVTERIAADERAGDAAKRRALDLLDSVFRAAVVEIKAISEQLTGFDGFETTLGHAGGAACPDAYIALYTADAQPAAEAAIDALPEDDVPLLAFAAHLAERYKLVSVEAKRLGSPELNISLAPQAALLPSVTALACLSAIEKLEWLDGLAASIQLNMAASGPASGQHAVECVCSWIPRVLHTVYCNVDADDYDAGEAAGDGNGDEEERNETGKEKGDAEKEKRKEKRGEEREERGAGDARRGRED